MMEIKCQSCGVESGKGVALFSLHAPCITYMCTDCIADEESESGTTAIFFFSKGIKFLSPEELANTQVWNRGKE